jgi:hypothetical protein
LERIWILLLIKVMQSATSNLKTLKGFVLNLYATIVSVHGPPWLFLNIYISSILACRSDAVPYPASQNDPDPQHWLDSSESRIGLITVLLCAIKKCERLL